MEEKIPELSIISDEINNDDNLNNQINEESNSYKFCSNNDGNTPNNNNENKINVLAIPTKKGRRSTIATSQKTNRSETNKIKKIKISENDADEQMIDSEINPNNNNLNNYSNNTDNINQINNQTISLKDTLNPQQQLQTKTKSFIQNTNANLTSNFSSKKMQNCSSNKMLKRTETSKSKQYSEILKGKSMKNNLKISTFEQRLNKIDSKFMTEARKRNENRSSKLDEIKQEELEYNIGWLFYSDQLKKKKREAIQESMKNNDKLTILLALIGIVLNIAASTQYITFSKSWNDEGTRISINIIPNNSNIVVFLRSLTSLCTLLLFFFLYRHYAIRLEFDKFKQKQPQCAGLYSAGLLWMFIFELIVCSVHSPPFLNNFRVNITQISGAPNLVDLDIFLSSLIPIRVYLLFRYYSFYSSWADDRAEKICNECNTIGGISFAIKAELKERPYTVVGVLMILSILIFGYALRNLELSFMQNKDPARFQDWTYVYNGFWCIIITILTVGYGDFYPQTSVGRAIAVIACLWGTFLISLMVVSLTISVEFTPQEQKAYEELKKGEVYRSLKTKALNLIRFSMKLRNFPEKRENIKDPDMRLKYIKTFDQLKHSLNEFSVNRKFVLSREHETGAENILYKLNENVGNEMENIIIISNREVTTLLDYLKLSQTIQQEIENYMEKLDKMTEGLEICLEANDNGNLKDKDGIQKFKETGVLEVEEKDKEKKEKEDRDGDGVENQNGKLVGVDCFEKSEYAENNQIKEGVQVNDENLNEEHSPKGNPCNTETESAIDSDLDLDKYSNGEIDKMHQELVYRNMITRYNAKKQEEHDSDCEEGKESNRTKGNCENDIGSEANKSKVLDIKPVERDEDSNSVQSQSIKETSQQADSSKSNSVSSEKTFSSKSNSVIEEKSFESNSQQD